MRIAEMVAVVAVVACGSKPGAKNDAAEPSRPPVQEVELECACKGTEGSDVHPPCPETREAARALADSLAGSACSDGATLSRMNGCGLVGYRMERRYVSWTFFYDEASGALAGVRRGTDVCGHACDDRTGTCVPSCTPQTCDHTWGRGECESASACSLCPGGELPACTE